MMTQTEDQPADRQLQQQIRARLPADAFVNRPRQAFLMVPFILTLVGGSVCLATVALPWPVATAIAVGLGLVYSSFVFFGHDLAHGAVVKSRRLRLTLAYAPFLILCLSPRLWAVWHNRAHHGFANIDKADPDCWGQVAGYRPTPLRNFVYRLTPGSRHWLSALYFPCYFTMQCQLVLLSCTGMRSFGAMRRRGLGFETVLMIAFWLAVAAASGSRALYVVLIPMVAANAFTMSYIATNHQLRPKRPAGDRSTSLATTMSVRTWRWLDIVHFHFSHHVEHHLFPTMASRHLPLVRAALLEIAPDDYLAPPQWLALVMLFRTPRFSDGTEWFADPFTGRRVAIREVERCLRAPRWPSSAAVRSAADHSAPR